MVRLLLCLVLLLSGCFATVVRGKKDVCRGHTPNDNPLVTQMTAELMDEIRAEPDRLFPPRFAFGTATAPYQIESGNAATDWAAWEKLGAIQNGDRADDGPQHERHFSEDIALMRGLHHDTYRLGIEWGRLFPTKEQFLAEPPQPDPVAYQYYRDLLTELRQSGIEPMVTLHHFTLPSWLASPPIASPAGVLEEEYPALLARFAAWSADAYGDLVDLWITINEPGAVAIGGYIGGVFPPGHFLAFDEFTLSHERFADAHAQAYDELRGHDRTDASGDGVAALISFATHNRLWLPIDAGSAKDVRGAKRVRYISNLLLLDAAVCGNFDRNFDEKLDEQDRVNDPRLKGRLDYIALNFYGTGWVSGADLEPFRGIPNIINPASGRVHSDFGWDVAPETLLPVLDELKQYELPIYITENGIADAMDTRRPRFIVDSLLAVSSAIARGHDVRGYYHWSLIDNFEWASGFCPRFGLFGVDLTDPNRARIEREGARVFREIAAVRSVPDALRDRYVYGAEGLRCK